MGAALDDAAVLQHQNEVARRVDTRWLMRKVVPVFRRASAARMEASVSASTALSESSKMHTGVFCTSIRAMATRCFCPPERVTPRSPTTVS